MKSIRKLDTYYHVLALIVVIGGGLLVAYGQSPTWTLLLYPAISVAMVIPFQGGTR